jgi:Holliday junction DNA helicase RuvA
VGEKVVLFTHQAIREDAHLLFGFGNAEERAVFRQLIKITGVGARTALSILSGMSIADLAQAVTLQEAGRLVKVPGIGKKTAERLLLELKGKLGADIGAAARTPRRIRNPTSSTPCWRWATPTRKRCWPENRAGRRRVSDGIKQALKALSKGYGPGRVK